ncbi:MAG: hypothetical protein RJA70_15 [Pseudomonadota bacterium]|jgi:hypothetical protein
MLHPSASRTRVVVQVWPQISRWLRLDRTLCALALWALVSGCESESIDQRPERVVEELIDRLQAVHGEPVRSRMALELFSADAQQKMAERAERASAASGRPISAGEMLVPSWFALRFEPKRFSTEIRGRYSRVTVLGEDPTRDLAEVQCIQEDGKWRVMLELPPLPPIETRDRQ